MCKILGVEDKDDAQRLLRNYLAVHFPELDVQGCLDVLDGALDQVGHLIAFGSKDAILVASIAPNAFFGGRLVATEILFFSQKPGKGKEVIVFFDSYAKEQGCVCAFVSAYTDRLTDYYGRLGFTPHEYHYRKVY